MASTSPNSLTRRAEELTSRHMQGILPVARAPAVATQSPLHEVLIAEVAASLPSPLANRLRSAASVDRLQDWLAAAALYPLVAHDPRLAKRYLAELGENPREANQALLRAHAAHAQAPRRDATWYWRDLLGACYQVSYALFMLLVRGLLFGALACWAGLTTAAWSDPALYLRGLLGWDLLAGTVTDPTYTILALGAAGLWLGKEAIGGTEIMETLRQRPARRAQLSLPVTWRADTFYLLWYAQSAALALCVVGRFFWVGVTTPWNHGWAAVPWGWNLLVGFVLMLTLLTIWAQAFVVIKLGGEPART
jgi:hypothetical protein